MSCVDYEKRIMNVTFHNDLGLGVFEALPPYLRRIRAILAGRGSL